MTFAAKHGADTPERATLAGIDHVAAMSELVAAREGYLRRHAGLVRLALDLSREFGVDAGEVRAAMVRQGEGEPRSRAEQIVELAAAYQTLVAERPYRASISETEALTRVPQLFTPIVHETWWFCREEVSSRAEAACI